MNQCGTEANSSTRCSTQGIDIQCYLILNNSTQKIFIATICIVMGALCILENTLVLSMIFTSSLLRKKPSYLFISSLATADLLASLIFCYSFVDFHVFHGAGTRAVFLFKLGGVTLSFTASLGSLLLTAFDRYICIHKPSAYKVMVTRKRALLALTVMWVSTAIISYLPLMGVDCCSFEVTCSELFPLIGNKYLSSWIVLVVILLSSIIFSYSHILWKAHRHASYMKRHSIKAEKGQARVRLDIMLAKTLAFVLIVLIACWSPVLILMIHSLIYTLDAKVKAVFAFCSTLCLVNSMVNPIVYGLRSRELRRRLMIVLRNLKCLRKLSNSQQDINGTEKNKIGEATCDDTVCDTEVST
ncbi:cannabinoid receptor 2 [Hyla sarda]|uniref:cannabinoid receptor 2 n=1 Tax=Hyla sarda TaxID=327740 RepID=UPI0024C34E3D|nr:cannabinoid receptor 2 [Hyla sarda]XP_056416556.1 cannabinoid receptor 2 [Hyla sarda]XP_056416557.1 cannabinoid receptor 2 [Hyla sarda]